MGCNIFTKSVCLNNYLNNLFEYLSNKFKYKISLILEICVLFSQSNFKIFKQIEGYLKAISTTRDLYLHYLLLG